MREETCCHNMGYSLRLAARVLLYASSHRQDNTYHSLCYTSRGALDGTRNSSMGPHHEGSIRWPIAPWVNTLTTELHLAPYKKSCEICSLLLQFTINVVSVYQAPALGYTRRLHRRDDSLQRRSLGFVNREAVWNSDKQKVSIQHKYS